MSSSSSASEPVVENSCESSPCQEEGNCTVIQEAPGYNCTYQQLITKPDDDVIVGWGPELIFTFVAPEGETQEVLAAQVLLDLQEQFPTAEITLLVLSENSDSFTVQLIFYSAEELSAYDVPSEAEIVEALLSDGYDGVLVHGDNELATAGVTALTPSKLILVVIFFVVTMLEKSIQ
jgi:hypothetical protein